jgi:DnaJ-class molecular chaperone
VDESEHRDIHRMALPFRRVLKTDSEGTPSESDNMLMRKGGHAMRCKACHGTGWERAHSVEQTEIGEPDFLAPYPCPECGGTGIAHCCEGLCADRLQSEEERGGEP